MQERADPIGRKVSLNEESGGIMRFVALSLALSIWFLIPDAVMAQTASDEDLHIQQAEIAETQLTPEEATAIILDRLRDGEQQDILNSHLLSGFQQGGNFALVNQHGELNTVIVNQLGLANLAVIDQEGARNRTELDQIGNRNIFGAWLRGNDNLLSLLQEGDDNVYILDFEGDGLNHSVDQVGSGIQAVQVGYGSQPFSIQQYGSGMEIRIEHNP
jgi:hypothetical protein